MKGFSIAVLLAVVLGLVGCGAGGGDVDTNSVQKQADKEKQINNGQALPPGEGPSG